MPLRARPLVYLHACARVPECDCGERSWSVQPPDTHMFRDLTPDPWPEFATLPEAMDYARNVLPHHVIPYPEHP